MYTIMYKINEYFQTIALYLKNIIKWSPILWTDRDYDQWYILNVLQFKIQKTAKYFNIQKRYVGYERDIERMLLCVKLLEKIKDGYYETEYFDYYQYKPTISKHSKTFDITKELLFDNLSVYFDKYKHAYRESYDQNYNSLQNAIMLADYMQAKAQRILFKIIAENISKWWD